MDDADFDKALITAAFARAAEVGWCRLHVADAARDAGLPLDRARARFPGRNAVLMRFGRAADQAALAGATTEGTTRDRLFDLLMRRIDALQANREGMLALFRALPADPPLALLLGAASLRSMGWMLEAAGASATGPRGLLRAKGLLAVWLWTVRAWRADSSETLDHTMSALDHALNRAAQAEAWLGGRRAPPGEPAPEPEPDLPAGPVADPPPEA